MPRLSNNRTLPNAIMQLKLCYALRNCGQVKVINAFDKSNNVNLYVYDDANLKYSDWNNNKHAVLLSKTFNAQNPNNNTLVLLPLDGCIITGAHFIQGGVCDCALLTDKEMSFVEFKTNALSPNNFTIFQHAQKAKDQLWHTYDKIIDSECKNIGIEINQYVSIDFYVVFDSNFSVTGVRADLQNLQDEFLMNNHYPLFFENSKQFK